jgi:hypothetical protein
LFLSWFLGRELFPKILMLINQSYIKWTIQKKVLPNRFIDYLIQTRWDIIHRLLMFQSCILVFLFLHFFNFTFNLTYWFFNFLHDLLLVILFFYLISLLL